MSRVTIYSLDLLVSPFWNSYSISSSNCSFLTCIQISQEVGKVVWYSHFFKIFPQFIVIHTLKGFSRNMFFWNFPCFFCDPTDVGNLIFGSSAFSKSSLYIWNFSVHVLLKQDWRILNITLFSCEMTMIVWYFEQSLALPFLGIGIKTELFQSSGNCRVFQSCWNIECSTLIALSFRIWNSSAGIPTPPLALFVVMLPKAHLILHSRMSGSRWLT